MPYQWYTAPTSTLMDHRILDLHPVTGTLQNIACPGLQAILTEVSIAGRSRTIETFL